jgi:hypothetical protein
MDKLQEQLKAEQEAKRQKESGETLPIIDNHEKHNPTTHTPQERINNANSEIEALQVERKLEAVRKGYADFQEQQKAFESAMSKYPDWQTKEELLNQREIEIKEIEAFTLNYSEEKKTEADEYFTNKIQDADEQYRRGIMKLESETKELRVKIDKATKDLDIRIQLYKEIIEPSRTILTKSINLIAQFLRGQGNPKQIYSILSGDLQTLENYAEQIKTSVDLSKLK